MKERITRREFLRVAGLTAAGLVLSACGYGKEEEESAGLPGNTPTTTKEPTKLPSPSLSPSPTETLTATPSLTPEPTFTSTVTPTPEPTFTPTKSIEQLLQERIVRWEKKAVFLGQGTNVGGLPEWSEKELSEYQKKREIFWGQVVTFVEEKLGLTPDNTDLLIGGGYALDLKGNIQERPFYALLITTHSKEKEVYCFQNVGRPEEIIWSQLCLKTPSEIVWGSGWESRVVKIKGVNRLILIDRTDKEEKYYLNLRRDPLGQLDTFVPVKMELKQAAEGWEMASKDYRVDSSRKTLSGLILTGSLKNEEEVNHYLFECPLPPLPKGKQGLKEHLLTEMDIFQGRILVFDFNQKQKDGNPALIGFWRLTEEVPKDKSPESVRWHSEIQAYQDYRSLFKDIPPTATPRPTPTETPRPQEMVFSGNGWRIENRNPEIVEVGINPSFVPRLEELMKQYNTPSLRFVIIKDLGDSDIPSELGAGGSPVMYCVGLKDGTMGCPTRRVIRKGEVFIYPEPGYFDLLRRSLQELGLPEERVFVTSLVRALTGFNGPEMGPLVSELENQKALIVKLNYLGK